MADCVLASSIATGMRPNCFDKSFEYISVVIVQVPFSFGFKLFAAGKSAVICQVPSLINAL